MNSAVPENVFRHGPTRTHQRLHSTLWNRKLLSNFRGATVFGSSKGRWLRREGSDEEDWNRSGLNGSGAMVMTLQLRHDCRVRPRHAWYTVCYCRWQFSSVQNSIYAVGKVHIRSTSSLWSFSPSSPRSSFNVGLTVDGTFSFFQERSSNASTPLS